MRIIFLITIAICVSFFSFSQELETSSPLSSNNQVVEKSKDQLVFAFNFDNLFHKETDGFKTKWHSRGIGVYFMYDISFKNPKVSFAPGAGFVHASYYTNASVVEDSSGTDFSVIPNFKDNDNYKRSKLVVNYFEIPVELRFRSKAGKKGKSWKAALGFKAGIKLTANSKEVRKENGSFKKFTVKGYPDVSLFRAGPTFRLGHGPFNIQMFYSVTELFKKDKGPAMTPFSIGISFNAL